ncbi:MAG: hypothetical protein ACRD0G_10985 [Acidimicrobiales bacterium]
MKVARLRADDRACFLVESGAAWTELAAVELPVRASFGVHGDEATAVAERMPVKYAAFRPAPSRLPGATNRHYSSQALIRLDPAGPPLSWDNSRIRLLAGNRSDKETTT